MKFSTIIRRALKPRLMGKRIKYFAMSHCWGLDPALDYVTGTHTITDIEFKFTSIADESHWSARDTESYEIHVTAVDDDNDSIRVRLHISLESLDEESDRQNHSKRR